MTRKQNHKKKCRRKHLEKCEEKEACEIKHDRVERATKQSSGSKASKVPCSSPCPCPPEIFDVIIVGGGPHALAVLSALSEKRANLRGWEVNYVLNHQTGTGLGSGSASSGGGKKDDFSILVIDPQGWLQAWNDRFKNLNIQWLRSPYHAHPDATEDGAMLTYAQSNGIHEQNTKLIDKFWASESPLKGQLFLSSGLFDLPSSSLFTEFCDTLLGRYPHHFHKSKVSSLSILPEKKGLPRRVKVDCSDKSHFVAKNVVLALGAPGIPHVPPQFAESRTATLKMNKKDSTEAVEPPTFHMADKGAYQPIKKGGRLLVIGGGLSAVQTALRFASEGARVFLCSRRPLMSQIFDLPLSFFDPLQHRRYRFEFYSLPVEERLCWIKKKRNGGTVPPFYFGALDKEDRIERMVDSNPVVVPGSRTVRFSCGKEIEDVERVILCTGSSVDCTSLDVIKHTMKNLSKDLDLEVVSGLPVLDEELKWGNADSPIHVVGALSMLQQGPDSPNLMGAKRGAEVIASAIGVYDNHFEDGGIRTNRFDLLLEE
mmetsp:Transcript_35110/g.54747  ORF Transcript_35110/g.54747 Transcript_35110/m.54747 type:complete len:541 (-) Transcript_35110:471-2093(-)